MSDLLEVDEEKMQENESGSIYIQAPRLDISSKKVCPNLVRDIHKWTPNKAKISSFSRSRPRWFFYKALK